MSDRNLLCLALGVITILASIVYLNFPSYHRTSTPKPTISIDTPPRSMSPTADDKKSEEITSATSAYQSPIPTDMPTPPPSPRGRRKPSITALITNILPSRRGSLASPATPAVGTGDQPVINRSKNEIEAYGDFPDYAMLSGVRLPDPYPEFNIETALARPYRPFRWSYHQTMAFWKMEPDWWLELENTYVERIHQRKELFATHGKAVLDSLPGSEAACKETMEMALQFLAARYPQYFSFVNTTSTVSLAPDLFINKILNREFRIREIDPLVMLLENVPEDFALTMQDPDSGLYVFRAGVICSSLGWNLGTKLGLTLSEIHAPVPDYKEKLKFSIDRFFTKLTPGTPIQRGSWGLEIGKPLYMPSGDPHELHRLSQNEQLTTSDVNLRVDWQTLRRMPLSGAIVFNFKALFTPVEEFRNEPGIPQIVAKVLREGKKPLMEYKNTWHVEHVVLPALDTWGEKQVKDGLVEREWEVATLEESPWFKGWREKWRGQQGY